MPALGRLHTENIFRARRLIVPYLLRPLSSIGLCLTVNDRKLAGLKDRHAGRRCFIIGNGPSLKITDLDRLHGEITFASNKIYLAFDQTEWRPTYYCVEDTLVVKQHAGALGKLDHVIKFFPFYMKKYIPPLKNALYFYLQHEDFYPHPPRFGKNACHKLYWGCTVTYTLIQLAFYMGIRTMFLIGVDFDYTIPDGSHDTHLSMKVYESSGEKNYFHPEYMTPGELNFIPNLFYHEKAFVAARKEIEQCGGQIFNATRGGKLEVFTRVDIDSLFR